MTDPRCRWCGEYAGSVAIWGTSMVLSCGAHGLDPIEVEWTEEFANA
jgi:hypothetical protein